MQGQSQIKLKDSTCEKTNMAFTCSSKLWVAHPLACASGSYREFLTFAAQQSQQ
jgi:hypothetical protein